MPYPISTMAVLVSLVFAIVYTRDHSTLELVAVFALSFAALLNEALREVFASPRKPVAPPQRQRTPIVYDDSD
jgi:hypothetical protein